MDSEAPGAVTRHAKWRSHVGNSKKRVEPITQDQHPTFLLEHEGKKSGVLRGYCGIQKFNMIIVPHVKSDVEEADVDSRRPYPRMARPGR